MLSSVYSNWYISAVSAMNVLYEVWIKAGVRIRFWVRVKVVLHRKTL